MDEVFIYVTVISSLFGILGLLIINFFWFKKQTFKVKLDFLKKKNDLEFKKLAKELGLPTGKNQQTQTYATEEKSENPLSALIPEIVKNLDAEQIGALADRFLPSSDDGGGVGGFDIDTILKYAAENPEVAKAFLGGLTGGKKTQSNEPSQV